MKFKEIKCYLNKQKDGIYLKDKESNKIVICNTNIPLEAEAWTSFMYYCTFYDVLFDKNNLNNYILFYSPNKAESDTEIKLSDTSYGTKYIPVRYKLILDNKNSNRANIKDLINLFNKPATLDYVLDNIYSIIQLIETIEEQHNIALIHNRNDIKTAIIEFNEYSKFMPETYAMIIHKFSLWRDGLMKEYSKFLS